MPAISISARNREQVILDHLPLVKTIATGVHRRCPSEVLHEDLVSAGVVGLLQAHQRFDKRRKLKLRTLAAHRIRGAMLDICANSIRSREICGSFRKSARMWSQD